MRYVFSSFRAADFYYLFFLGCSVAGIFTRGYAYCFHLFHVIVGNDILLRVLRAITKNGISLLWVGLLGVIIIYVYSIFAFAFFRNDFPNDDGLFCDTMWECFLASLNFGNYLIILLFIKFYYFFKKNN